LSQQRADAAMRGLMRDGVAKDRLKAVGYGEQNPVGDNATRKGRVENRRVEFHAGDELPFPVVATDVKAEPKPVVKAKKVKAEKKETVDAVSVTTLISETVAISETTSKPWWARKMVSETAVDVK
jgi:hypothetical protein